MCTLCALDFCGAGLCKCSVCASVSHSVPSPPPTPKKSFRPRGLNRRNIDAYDVLHEKDFFLFSKQVVIVFCCWTFLCFFLFFFFTFLPLQHSGSVLAQSWLLRLSHSSASCMSLVCLNTKQCWPVEATPVTLLSHCCI